MGSAGNCPEATTGYCEKCLGPGLGDGESSKGEGASGPREKLESSGGLEEGSRVGWGSWEATDLPMPCRAAS